MATVVVVMALEENEQDLPVLYVKSLPMMDGAQTTTTVVPYFPEMQLWEYLRNVLGPRVGIGGLSPDGSTVMDTFLSNTNSTGAQVVFNRSNRLLRLGDLVPPDAVLHYAGTGGARGNAVRGDVVEPCSICLEKDTDFELPCHHRFHARCIGEYALRARLAEPMLCPMCRTPLV